MSSSMCIWISYTNLVRLSSPKRIANGTFEIGNPLSLNTNCIIFIQCWFIKNFS